MRYATIAGVPTARARTPGIEEEQQRWLGWDNASNRVKAGVG
jgi:hypothetical protein